ncbi:MAG: alanine--tRNA ligase [Bacilli bacterium]|nr:alanine--tRNA ligase [Bacilli bacterium]
MNLKDLYINFFISKGHVQIPSAPVIPENDPTSLFNTAGMQPLVPYLLGQTHPAGNRLVDYQKCIRLTDLDNIGDTTHHTFFEMLGNWSLGDYFKEESIVWSFEFLTEVLKIPVSKLAVTVFRGNDSIPKDEVSASIWKKIGISEDRISYLGEKDNFWIAGETGPCGPDTEIFYWRSNDPVPVKHDPNDKRWVEIWNNVFMQYNKDASGNFSELPSKNVDTGMGYERTVAVLEGVEDNYLTSIWKDIINKIEELSNLKYEDEDVKKSMRIVADHIRTSVFISADNASIKPSNTDQGYILRRLIRRAIRHAKKLGIDPNSNWEEEIAKIIINNYSKYYSELTENRKEVLEVLRNEKVKFNRTLEKGLREFEKIIISVDDKLNKDLAFKLYDTYGFPIELTVELANEKGVSVDVDGFNQKFVEHQEKSRAGATQKFKGGLSSSSNMNVKYHTATHLLNAALKAVLGPDVHQKGSNITDERMRFDFSYDHKMTDEEIKKTEIIVNNWIKEEIPVTKKEMSKEEALKIGAEALFVDKYGDVVTVYSIGNISKELCGGPHVTNTNELMSFKIIKEKASSAGVRRIKAILEDKKEEF